MQMVVRSSNPTPSQAMMPVPTRSDRLLTTGLMNGGVTASYSFAELAP